MENLNNNNLQNIFVVLLCGIPGVGKTYFSKLFNEYFKKDEHKNVFVVVNINFDDIFIKFSKFHENKFELDILRFKESRQEFFSVFVHKINEIKYLNEYKGKNIFLLLDDNFYFKSMRKPFFKYCKNFVSSDNDIQMSYLEIHFKCSIEYALNNNKMRKDFELIPENVIEKINNNFQWNTFVMQDKLIHNVIIDTQFSLTDKVYVDSIINSIIKKSKDNIKVIKELKEIENKMIIKQNKKEFKTVLLDKLEVIIRKKISDIIKNTKELGKIISMKKKEFLFILKNLIYTKLDTNNKNFKIEIDYEAIINLSKTIESIKENSYEINNNYLNIILYEFEKFVCHK